jgi:hypothetical protein
MKICIVGNGACALKVENGKFIDSCDEVVRIKNFQTVGFEQYVGSKTDIYSSKWFGWFDRKTYEPLKFNFLDNVHTLMFMFPDERLEETQCNFSEYTLLYKELQLHNELPLVNKDWDAHLQCLNNFNIDHKNTVYFSLQDVEKLCVNILKIDSQNYITTKGKMIEPTCGIRTIFKILQLYPDSEIFLTGFDCFQTSWYWNSTHKINSSHYYLKELLYLKHLEKTQRITLIDKC